jgi:hypothetical protein
MKKVVKKKKKGTSSKRIKRAFFINNRVSPIIAVLLLTAFTVGLSLISKSTTGDATLAQPITGKEIILGCVFIAAILIIVFNKQFRKLIGKL